MALAMTKLVGSQHAPICVAPSSVSTTRRATRRCLHRSTQEARCEGLDAVEKKKTNEGLPGVRRSWG
jgi:hypothetical protein